MVFAKVGPGVNPHQQVTLIILFMTFNMISCIGFVILFFACLFSPRLRQNKVFLSHHAGYAVAGAGNSILGWTGYAFTADVPYPLCVASAALSSSVSLLQTCGALCLVAKVWSQVLLSTYPRLSFLRMISTSNVLVVAPWVIAAPFLVSALVLGFKNEDMVTRASPFYCWLQFDTLNLTMMVFDAVFDIGTVTLAGWTAVLVIRNRRRTRELRSTANPYFSLMIRTSLFAVLLSAAFITNVTIDLTSFSNHVAYVIIALVAMLLVFVFGSDPTILRILRCQREADTPVVTEHSISVSLQPPAPGDSVMASGIQNVHKLSSIRRPPGLNSESEWKGVVVDGLAFESTERLEEVSDGSGLSSKAKYAV